MTELHAGGCQCAAVRYEISGEPLSAYVCHCTECQKQSGSAFGMAVRVARTDFRLIRGSLRSWTRTAESGRLMECAFCPECGTRIYHVAQRFQDHLSIKPGTLDDQRWIRPTHHIYVRSALPWVAIPKDVTVMQTIDQDPTWMRGRANAKR